MVKRTLTAALFLFAASAWAQPTPFRVPPKYTVATAPACVDGEPKLYAVTDAASSASCTIAGGSTEVICKCTDGTAAVVAAGSGGSSNSFETINAPAGTDPVADSATDTLNVTCSGGLTCTGTAATDTLDFTMGTASAATALAADPADCSANQFANAIAASGALTCAAIGDADVPDGITVTLAGTATALAANGANCSAGQYPLGVDASGAVESCTADNAGTDDQTATEVPYTPTTGTDWTDPDPASAGEGLDDLAGRLTIEEGKADDDVPDAGEVAVSAIANGTGGELITWGADGVATTVATGTATQVLTSNGAGAAPTFQDAAGGIGGSTGATDDAMLAADGTGGATLQARDLTISDVAAGVVTLATTAGNALAIANTNPAATTGASVAGDPLTISAGNAVASTDTAGAAAGGDVTITAGSAARNTSGSANGGNINLNAGATIGGAFNGQILIGTTGAWNRPSVSFPTSTTTGFYLSAANMFTISGGGVGYNFSSTALSSANTPLFYGFKDLVEANTAGSGTPNAIAATETGTVFTNEGVTAANHHTLPSAAAGYQFTFVVQDADGIRVNAAAGDVIHIPGDASTAGGYCESTTPWDQLEVVSINATDWAGSPTGAGWTCDGP